MPAQAKYHNSVAFGMLIIHRVKVNASIKKTKPTKKARNYQYHRKDRGEKKMRVVLMKSQRIYWKFSILID